MTSALILGGLGEPIDRLQSCCYGLLTLAVPSALMQAAAKMRLDISYRIFSAFPKKNDQALSALSIALCSSPLPTSSHATLTERFEKL